MANAFPSGLRPASFRGVAFEVNGADFGAGRRVQVHEYPQRDAPYTEDLGRATREVSVEGFLVGADYIEQANRLLAALETAGAGTLIHPWLGAMQVCLKDPARVRFDAGLGVATVSMSFVESGELAFPSPSSSTQAVSRLAADGLSSAAVSDFAQGFSVADFQSFVSAAAQAQMAAMLGVLGGGQLAQILGTATNVSALITQLAACVSNPAQLGTVLAGALGLSTVASTVAAWSGVVKLVIGTVRSAGMQPSATAMATTASVTPSRQRINANTIALYGLARQLLLAQAVGMSSLVGSRQDSAQAGLAALTQQDQGTTGEVTVLPTGVVVQTIAGITQPQAVAQKVTQDTVLTVRDSLLAALDAEALLCGDAVYAALQEARTAVYADLTARAQGLEQLALWTPAEVTSALVIAYALYADATRDAEIVLRNGIRHPGFVPPVPLSVLTA